VRTSALSLSQQKSSLGASLGASSRLDLESAELHEKVWQFPLSKLAAEYGISDVGLAKVCRKLEIPLPGLGHWTGIAGGHTIARPPLPAMENAPVLIRQTREPETPILPEDIPELERIERVAEATDSIHRPDSDASSDRFDSNTASFPYQAAALDLQRIWDRDAQQRRATFRPGRAAAREKADFD
jgi:hypothetical protein